MAQSVKIEIPVPADEWATFGVCFAVLKELKPDERVRVIRYLNERFDPHGFDRGNH
jgi:hypothetical protein